jgi:hypothetical protein
MGTYAVYINEQAFEAASRSAIEREHVMKFIRSLASNPNTAGDFTEKDHTGRTVHVRVIGRYAITFWADHAVSEIKVTHIKPADK